MVEVELIRGAANHALAAISPPHFQLYVRRDDAPTSGVEPDGFAWVLIALDGDELELEDLSAATLLAPRVDQMENPVVGPDALPELLIYTDTLRRSLTSLGLLGSLVKEPVLRQAAR
jgi:hypothetical protein